MAKEVKVFSGSTATSMTVYTVPTGRTAKVVINHFKQAANSGYTPPTMQIGGMFTFGSNSDTSQWIPKLDTSSFVREDSLSFQSPLGGSIPSVPKTYYLTQGQQIIFSNGPQTGTASEYNILVVEEY